MGLIIFSNATAQSIGAMIYGQPSSINDKSVVLTMLRTNTVRESIVTGNWPGNGGTIRYWDKLGYQNVLNISYRQQATSESVFCPADSLNSFKKKVEEILTSVNNVPLVVLENEEANKGYRNFSNTSLNDYINELKAACEVAHELNVKCTNGGLTTVPIVIATYRWLDSINSKDAAWFLKNCVPVRLQYAACNKGKRKTLEAQVSDVNYLLNQYKVIPIDFINVHTYFPLNKRGGYDVNNKDTSAAGLSQVISFVKAKTGKNVISNETGTLNQNEHLVNNVLAAYEKENIEYLLWWSGDGGDGKAKPLHNADGSLTVNGISFQKFMESIK